MIGISAVVAGVFLQTTPSFAQPVPNLSALNHLPNTSLVRIAQNTQNPALARTTPLELKHKQLKQDTSALLKRLIAERAKVLEEMRKQARADMAEWENDPNYLNGKGLKAALLTSEAVANGYGFDVPKLRKMYLVTKKSILGLEMVTKCGKSSPTLNAAGKAVDSISSTAKGAMDYFGLAANEEERLACVQTEKLKLYREVNRAYIYALTAKSAKDSAEGFRRYAGLIQTELGRDGAFIVQQAKDLADNQDTVLFVFELVPVVGELLDLYKLGVGTDVMGGKASDVDRALAGVGLLAPEIVTQLFKRSPEIYLTMKSFISEVIVVKGGFFDSAIIRAGQELAPFKQKAMQVLSAMLEVEKKIVDKMDGKVLAVASESIDAVVKRLEKMPTYHMSKQAAIAASNMIPDHMDAMIEVAGKTQQILMFRPFNPLGKDAMQNAVNTAKTQGWRGKIATKWMDIKPKSASNPLLGAGIPADPALSKLNDPLVAARKANDPAAIVKAEEEIAEMEVKAQKLFAKVDNNNIPIVSKTPAQYNGQNVMWAVDKDGNKVMGVLNSNGKLYDPITDTTFDIGSSRPQIVELITDNNQTAILPDYDLFAVSGKTISGGGRYDAATGRMTDEAVVFEKNALGNTDTRNLEAMTAINQTVVKKTGVKGDVVHHGSANFWTDNRDFPITIIMPDGKVISLAAGPASNPDKWIQEFFHVQTLAGYRGLVPHPSWGWPTYNPRFGYNGGAS